MARQQAKQKMTGVGSVRHTGRAVAALMNNPPTPAQDRIGELLRQMAATIALPDDSEEVPEAIQRINEMLRPYVWRDRFAAKRGEYLFGGAVSAAPDPIEDAELLSARCIVELAEQGFARAIRQCPHCHKWFFSTRLKRKTYHDNNCRLAHLKTSPEKRAKRREYQKNYYRNVLSPITGRYATKRKKRQSA